MVRQIIPFPQELRPRLPTIVGNVDYLTLRQRLEQIDILLRQSGVERDFVQHALARWKRAGSGEPTAHEQVKFFVGGRPAAFPLTVPAGKSVEVEFRFPPQTRTGSLRDYIIVRSNDTYRSTQTVYFSRYVVTKKELKDLFNKYRGVLDEKR